MKKLRHAAQQHRLTTHTCFVFGNEGAGDNLSPRLETNQSRNQQREQGEKLLSPTVSISIHN